MVSKFLFFFGFEDPIEHLSNQRQDTDFESSRALWIEASSANAAMVWGKIIAHEYVSWLFAKQGQSGYSWQDTDFACWIEENPENMNLSVDLDSLPEVKEGQWPSFADIDSWGKQV